MQKFLIKNETEYNIIIQYLKFKTFPNNIISNENKTYIIQKCYKLILKEEQLYRKNKKNELKLLYLPFKELEFKNILKLEHEKYHFGQNKF